MYRIIWKYISSLELGRKQKQRVFIIINLLLYACLGIMAWNLFGLKTFNGDIVWFICFVGYPAVLLGFAGSIFALFKLDQ